ncbi:MAG: hypothetical protein ABS944_03455 [Solibacillus sp.]|uniref:hypothetical protein n=1 Tax=unclassified Solibacillus TaxID=2637870 RepID=UPI0030F8BEAF
MTKYQLTPLRNTAAHKKNIIEKTRSAMETPPSKKKKAYVLPALIASLAFVLTIFIAGPSIQQALWSKQNITVEKVVIPNVPYESLITSTYVEESNEFVYNTAEGFFSFDVTEKHERLIVNTSEVGRIFDYAVSENWLVWAQPVEDVEKIHVYDRKHDELTVLNNDYFYGIELKDNTIIYMALNDDKPSYMKADLLTGEKESLREFEEGSNSRPAIDGSKIAISESVELDKQTSTTVSVHNFETLQNTESYILPYEIAQNVLLKGNHIFALLWNSDEQQPAIIGTIDTNSNEFNIIETSVGVDAYATDGRHFALSVQKGDSNTVQLFELEEGKLKRTSSLPKIKERLVKPRFTEQGTLVVNGEGQDRAMYLIRFK